MRTVEDKTGAGPCGAAPDVGDLHLLGKGQSEEPPRGIGGRREARGIGTMADDDEEAEMPQRRVDLPRHKRAPPGYAREERRQIDDRNRRTLLHRHLLKAITARR